MAASRQHHSRASPLRAWLRDYETHWRVGDLERVVSLYARDGVLVGTGTAAAFGRVAIRRALRADLDAGVSDLRFEVTREWGSETTACAVGRYRANARHAGETQVTRRGVFVLVLRKQADGAWRAVADAFVAGPAGG